MGVGAGLERLLRPEFSCGRASRALSAAHCISALRKTPARADSYNRALFRPGGTS